MGKTYYTCDNCGCKRLSPCKCKKPNPKSQTQKKKKRRLGVQ
jgi:hypothetical protein